MILDWKIFRLGVVQSKIKTQVSEISDLKFEISNRFSGDFVGRVTPVPIPNTEVKPAGADGTARVTAWESRKSPGLLNEARSVLQPSGLLVFDPRFKSLSPDPRFKNLLSPLYFPAGFVSLTAMPVMALV